MIDYGQVLSTVFVANFACLSLSMSSSLPRTRAASFSSVPTPEDFVRKCIARSPFLVALREANTPRRLRPLTVEEVGTVGFGVDDDDVGRRLWSDRRIGGVWV